MIKYIYVVEDLQIGFQEEVQSKSNLGNLIPSSKHERPLSIILLAIVNSSMVSCKQNMNI